MSMIGANNDREILPAGEAPERLLVFILATMTFLAGLTLLVSIAGFRASAAWQADIESTATVQVFQPDIYASETHKTLTLETLEANIPGGRFDLMSAKQSRKLLEPWLGSVDLPEDLPVPAMIKLELPPGLDFDYEVLSTALRDAGIDAEVDDHKRWNKDIQRSMRHVQYGLLCVLVIILLATLATSGFATLTTLRTRGGIVHILDHVGASDMFIIRLFAWRFFKLAIVAGIGGGVAVLVFFVLVGASASVLETRLIPVLQLSGFDLAVLTFLVGLLSVLSAGAAGLTAWFRLRRKSEIV